MCMTPTKHQAQGGFLLLFKLRFSASFYSLHSNVAECQITEKWSLDRKCHLFD
jgi:hypothetical protein